ncbi:hypothetical protein [Geodermatophilus sp. SYSU D00710]
MPNAAPPRHPAARCRTAESPAAAAPRPTTRPGGGDAATTAPASSSPTPSPTSSSATLTGVPASWTGLSALLTGAGERAPADALTLASLASGAGGTGTRGRVDLSGIWALPADMADARSHSLLRTLDDKGRLQLPVDAEAASKLPAERDGALVTVFLPGSPDTPRPNFAIAALPLDGRGRLTVTAGVRRQAGIPDAADVFAVVDPDRRTVTLTAASRLTAGIAGLLGALRRPAPGPDASAPAEHGAAPVPTGTDDPATALTAASTAEPAAGLSGGRLRIVG